MNNLIKPDNKKEIGVAAEMIFLLNTRNGRILPWSPILSVNPVYVDCDRHGKEIGSPTGDNEYILQETKNLAKRMGLAGATGATLNDFGRHLTDMGNDKFRALENKRKEQDLLGYHCVTDEIEAPVEHPEPDDPVLKRLYAKIDRHADRVHQEIEDMTITALGMVYFGHKPDIHSRGEVSFEWRKKTIFDRFNVEYYR